MARISVEFWDESVKPGSPELAQIVVRILRIFGLASAGGIMV
jgi:hypothetical protein